MDALQEFLEDLKRHGLAVAHLLGLCNVLIGRKVAKADGTAISNGLTWRELAALLKKARWDKETVRELGAGLEELSPRDRQQFWYAAIAHAGVDSEGASAAGDRLAERLRKLGYEVGPPPGKTK